MKFSTDMNYIDPNTDLSNAIDIFLEAPSMDTSWVKTTWTNKNANFTEVRRNLQRAGEDEELDGVAWYIKD